MARYQTTELRRAPRFEVSNSDPVERSRHMDSCCHRRRAAENKNGRSEERPWMCSSCTVSVRYGVQLFPGRRMGTEQTIAQQQQQHATRCAARQHTIPPRRDLAVSEDRTSEAIRCVVTIGERRYCNVNTRENRVKASNPSRPADRHEECSSHRQTPRLCKLLGKCQKRLELLGPPRHS